MFERVVCGVDASDAGLAAARAAGRLTDPLGRLVLVSVEDPSAAVLAGERVAHEARSSVAVVRG